MIYDGLKNSAQPALQPGRSAATASVFSPAVQNPGASPATGGTPLGGLPQGLVPSGGGAFSQGAFAPGQTPVQPVPWAMGGNPVMQQMMAANGGSPMATGAFGALNSQAQSALSSPIGRFGGAKGR